MKKNKTQKLLLIIALVTVLLSGILYLSRNFGSLKLDKDIGNFKKVTFLLHAISDTDNYYFSVLISLYPKEKKCALFFINPLSSFEGDDETLEQLGSSAPSRLEGELNRILGFNPNFIITINETNFKKIINFVGGIPYYFEPKTFTPSNSFNRPESGYYNLDGKDAYDLFTSLNSNRALDYVARLEKQESAILSFYNKVFLSKDEIKKPWFTFLYSIIQTNMEESEWLSLIDFLLAEEIYFGVSELPGELIGIEKTDRSMLKIKKDTVKIAYNKFEADILSEFFSDTERSRIEVLNGTSINGLAKKAKSLLSENRIKVLSVENAWSSNIKESIVLDRSGNSKVSFKISNTLNNMPRFFIIRKELGLDSTVVLGEDFDKAK